MNNFSIDRGVPLPEGVTVQWAKDRPELKPVEAGVPHKFTLGDKTYVRCVCPWCSSKEDHDISAAVVVNDAYLVGVFVSANWGLTNLERLICPKCEARRVEETRRETSRESERRSIIATRTAVESSAREPTPPELRMIMASLEDHFSDGVWAAGWSDKRVAEGLVLPMAMIKRVREEAFGVERNPELTLLRADYDRLRDRMLDLGKRISVLESRG